MVAIENRSRASAPFRGASKREFGRLFETGIVYREARRFSEARDAFHSIGMLDPAEPLAEIGLGSVCFAEGYFEDAIVHYRRALKISPNSAYAFALLGEAQLFQENYVGARTSLRRALELGRRTPFGVLAHHLLQLVDCLSRQESLE